MALGEDIARWLEELPHAANSGISMRAWRNWLTVGFSLLALAAAAQTADQLQWTSSMKASRRSAPKRTPILSDMSHLRSARFTVEAVQSRYAARIVLIGSRPTSAGAHVEGSGVLFGAERRLAFIDDVHLKLIRRLRRSGESKQRKIQLSASYAMRA